MWYIYGICGAYPLVQQFAEVLPNPQVLTDQNINVFPIRTFLHMDKIQNIFAKISTLQVLEHWLNRVSPLSWYI